MAERTLMYDKTQIGDYLNALASKAPAPGGGSVAALIGAIGCATLGKVVNFTLGKEKYKAHEEEMADILKRLDSARESFNQLCSEDAKVYGKLREAFKMPKGEERDRKIEDALRDAITVPLDVCIKSREAIEMCLPVVKKGNPNLMTDTGIAGLAFKCAFEAGILNVEINLKDLKDKDFRYQTKTALKELSKEIDRLNREVSKMVEEYMLKQKEAGK